MKMGAPFVLHKTKRIMEKHFFGPECGGDRVVLCRLRCYPGLKGREGHDESLIVFLGENDERQYLYPEEFHNGFFRFSVGIEDVEDIIGDLKQAMEKAKLEVSE